MYWLRADSNFYSLKNIILLISWFSKIQKAKLFHDVIASYVHFSCKSMQLVMPPFLLESCECLLIPSRQWLPVVEHRVLLGCLFWGEGLWQWFAFLLGVLSLRHHPFWSTPALLLLDWRHCWPLYEWLAFRMIFCYVEILRELHPVKFWGI